VTAPQDVATSRVIVTWTVNASSNWKQLQLLFVVAVNCIIVCHFVVVSVCCTLFVQLSAFFQTSPAAPGPNCRNTVCRQSNLLDGFTRLKLFKNNLNQLLSCLNFTCWFGSLEYVHLRSNSGCVCVLLDLLRNSVV